MSKSNQWPLLRWWVSGERQVVEERLDDLDARKIPYCPGRQNIYKALTLVPMDKVKVVLLGQDPYPSPAHACGLAFSIPESYSPLISPYPKTLQEIFKEYQSDLGYPLPTDGDLSPWCDRGVLLWNALPTCAAWGSLSHDWPEWRTLTEEIVSELMLRGVVFAAMGRFARGFVKHISADNNRVIETSHPSPRASNASNLPFRGSRLFSSINDMLREIGHEPIDWRL